jgi:peptidoglycan/LPS O-acetylase OafA/YrhL
MFSIMRAEIVAHHLTVGSSMSKVMEKQNERVLVVDLLRVIAIAMVILSHVLITLSSSWPGPGQAHFGVFPFIWNTWGEIGVTMFLVISGFALGYTYQGKQVRLAPFVLRRIVRIYPVYYFSLIFALTLHIGFAMRASLLFDKPFTILPGFSYVDFLLALTGLNAFFGKWGGPLVWSSWFIGLIMTMYLLYPLIAHGLKRSPWLCMGLLFSISYFSRIVVANSEIFTGGQNYWFPLNRVFEFGAGVALVQLIPQSVLDSSTAGLQKVWFLPLWGDLSFPLFLIHDPLRRFITWGPHTSSSVLLGILVFIVLSVFVSIVALKLNKRIESVIRERYLARSECPI